MNWIINHSFDLTRGHVQPHFITNALIEVGDKESHAWNVALTDAGEAVDLTGATVSGYFIRADGDTVLVAGSASGNVATVLPVETCFAVQGDLKAVMKVSLGGATMTVDACLFYVRQDITDSYVDPGEVIPDLQDLLAMIDEMETVTTACETATAAAEAVATKSVRYDTAQQLTTAQKEQARANIGVTFVDDGEGNITMV